LLKVADPKQNYSLFFRDEKRYSNNGKTALAPVRAISPFRITQLKNQRRTERPTLKVAIPSLVVCRKSRD
jgi:hypothetical protein